MAKKMKAIGGDGSGGQPPVETRWKPGCPSPNPLGRPRTKGISEIAREFLEDIDPKAGKSRILRHFEVWHRMSMQGSSKHSELLFAYAYGRPAQNLHLSGELNIGDPEQRIRELLETADTRRATLPQ